MLIFGGTFDPIHNGHLNMAAHTLKDLNLEQLHFMPNQTPAHKAPTRVQHQDRLQMLRLAIQDHAHYALDLREMLRSGPSYSLLSVQEIRAELDQQGREQEPILFLIGMDSLNSFDKWYCWQDILSLCHLVVYQRPGESLNTSKQWQNYLDSHTIHQSDALLESRAANIYFVSGPPLQVSSSQIRQKVAQGQAINHLVPDAVADYIAQQQLYINP